MQAVAQATQKLDSSRDKMFAFFQAEQISHSITLIVLLRRNEISIHYPELRHSNERLLINHRNELP